MPRRPPALPALPLTRSLVVISITVETDGRLATD
jgi:hypothetical protein